MNDSRYDRFPSLFLRLSRPLPQKPRQENASTYPPPPPYRPPEPPPPQPHNPRRPLSDMAKKKSGRNADGVYQERNLMLCSQIKSVFLPSYFLTWHFLKKNFEAQALGMNTKNSSPETAETTGEAVQPLWSHRHRQVGGYVRRRRRRGKEWKGLRSRRRRARDANATEDLRFGRYVPSRGRVGPRFDVATDS